MSLPTEMPARQVPQVHFYPMQFQEQEVRYLFDPQGRPWWVAQDVCEVLGLGQVAVALRRLDADEKKVLLVKEMGPGQGPGRKTLAVKVREAQARGEG